MSDVEHLHQLILNLAARLQATEAVANAAIALAVTRTASTTETVEPSLETIFARLLESAAAAPDQATKKELDIWMRSREQDFLNASLQKIKLQRDALSPTQEQIVN
ncbi:hypothetical protein Brsp05_04108 [Brucella sp. NBRC 12953]|uniref:hypothetical protein n=1 Tax=Brucella sp. NBRC 12953 TaxID=3075481 RepID=UPI000DE572A0